MVGNYQSPIEETVDESPSDDETQGIQVVDRAGRPALTLNVDDYRQYVEALHLSEEQEQELLETLWTVIVSFVDLGFGIEPVQQATKSRAQGDARSETAEGELHHEHS